MSEATRTRITLSCGAYAKFRSHLVEGRPGSGKTTLGLQFLIQGAELGETVQSALAEIERIKPDRVVFDSLSEIRLLSQGSLRYRRQGLALKSFFLLNNATVLLLDDLTAEHDDLNLHSISHGVIRTERRNKQSAPPTVAHTP